MSASRGIEANEGFLNEKIGVEYLRHPGQARSADPGSHNRRNFAIADQVRNDVTSLPSYLPTLLPSKRAAFTLAEVLITLAIVGVVAAITLPPLITNIQSQVKAKRVQNIKQKFSKATDKMLAMSGMNGYGSTENFVNELQNHLKIAKVCDNNHLSDCWSYKNVKMSDGSIYDISNAKRGIDLKVSDDDFHSWDSTVGILTADGTPMILSYNTKCDMSMNMSPQWDENQSSSSNCVAGIFDWNGKKGFNMFSDFTKKDKADIISFNSNGLGNICGIVAGAGESCLGYPRPGNEYVTNAECNDDLIVSLGVDKCVSINPYYKGDYWLGAVKECGHISKMASYEDVKAVAKLLKKDKSLIEQLGFTTFPTTIWTNDYDKFNTDNRVNVLLNLSDKYGSFRCVQRSYYMCKIY